MALLKLLLSSATKFQSYRPKRGEIKRLAIYSAQYQIRHHYHYLQSEVIDLEDEEEIDDVEKEVIEVGDTPKKDKGEGGKRAAEGAVDEPESKRAKSDESENKD